MSLAHCSSCGERNSPKYSQVTWAWMTNGTQERHAYRQRLCPGCYASAILALDQERDPAARLTCPACGIDTETDYDAVYATAYVPHAGKITYEFPMCAVHADLLRADAMKNAELLPDRNVRGQESAPNIMPAGNDVWAQLGIRPRE